MLMVCTPLRQDLSPPSKKRRKRHQELLDLFLRHIRMYRFQLHIPLRRIVIRRIPVIRNMQLMSRRVRLHIILLGQPVDQHDGLLLVRHRNLFYFRCHILHLCKSRTPADPGPVDTAITHSHLSPSSSVLPRGQFVTCRHPSPSVTVATLHRPSLLAAQPSPTPARFANAKGFLFLPAMGKELPLD